MEAMRRKLVWVKTENFEGWACADCAGAFKPSGPVVGNSIEEMKTHYEQPARQGVRVACLRRAPARYQASGLAKSPAGAEANSGGESASEGMYNQVR